MSKPRPFVAFVVAAAVLWHLLTVLALGWTQAASDRGARDFASYYYAVDVAVDGGDPYDRHALALAARADKTRRGIHPYFYPPPFLLGMLWTSPFGLTTAYLVWFWLDEVALLVALTALWRWWRPLGGQVLPVIAVAAGLLTAVYDQTHAG
jgi:hypothetical protein